MREILDTSLSWGNKATIAHWSMPDYSAGVSVTTFPFTAPSDGVLKVNTNGYWDGYINGMDYTQGINVIGNSGGDQSCDYLLPEGTEITFNKQSGTRTITFYPLIGAT